MVVAEIKAPEGTRFNTQDMINTLDNLEKNLSVKAKEVLKEVSQLIFNGVPPREYDEVVTLTLYKVCQMKMRLDNLDSHKLIISDCMEQFKVFRGLSCTR